MMPRSEQSDDPLGAWQGLAWCVAIQAPIWVLIVLIGMAVTR